MSPSDTTIILGKQILKVSLTSLNSRVVVDLRYQYQTANGGGLAPTRRGVTLPAAAIHEIIASLEALKAEMERDGYLEYGGESDPPKCYPQVYPSNF